MIVDSHAHYAHGSYSNTFRYLYHTQQEYALAEGQLDQLIDHMIQAGIRCWVEPGVSLESNRRILELHSRYPGRLHPAMGVHPTRAIHEKWADRKQLVPLVQLSQVVAVGETGLDYHFPRKEQYRLRQYRWFCYQLRLAKKYRLPVILHIRDAHKPALALLRHYRNPRGGVVHCFNGDAETAMRYVALGYHIGIGGAVLQKPERAEPLWEAVRRIPLERILLETDAPFILPDCKDVIKPKLLRRARNTSMILPCVAEKIGQLKGVSTETVIRTTAENAAALFKL